MDETDGCEPDLAHPKASNICAIDKKSVHRICSGQVVLTLATAVKELLENSIDAGATIVDIKLKDYGSEQIEVSDNGSGVQECNFQGLTLKHHTSKLQDFTDLMNVETFGFRGEALSSLCALSTLNVTTRHKSASVGTRMEFDHNGKITKQTSMARQIGTTVTLQNLFYTLPVRHKEFQRNVKKEFIKMVQVLNSYCIISTGVRITCTNQTAKGNRSVVVASKGNTAMSENISNVFGPKQMSGLEEFVQKCPEEETCQEFGIKQGADNIFRVEGYVSKCEHGLGRSSTDRQFFFINGRPFDSIKLSKVVNEVYHQYNRHQYPFVVFKISTQKDNVDVNVTPDKRQVFMDGEKHILATVKCSLVAMYEPSTSILRMQQPAGIPSQLKSPLPESVDHIGLSRHQSLEKPSGLSSLQKLKRSFSSAFSKGDNSPQASPRSGTQPSKQRKLDAFVSSWSPAKRNKDTSLHKLSSPSKDIAGEGKNFEFVEERIHERSESFIIDKNCDSDRDTMNEMTENIDNCKRLSSEYQLINCDESKKDCSIIEETRKHLNTDTQKECDTTESCSSQSIKIVHHGVNSQAVEVSECKSNQQSIDADSDHHESLYHYQTSECSSLSEKISSERDSTPQQYEESLTNIDKHEAAYKNQSEFDEGHENMKTEEIPKIDCTVDACHIVDSEEDFKKAEKPIQFSMENLRDRWRRKAKNKEDGNKFSRAFRATINPAENSTAEQELQREIKKDMFSQMEILGQFNLGFIIAKFERDLFIVDQHATDEKYNFETLQRDYVIQSQKLICPMNLELTASNETILMDNLDVFRKNGFEFQIDENGPPMQRVKLASTPVSKNWNFGKEDIEEMIFMLTDSPGVLCRPSRVRAMFASRSCRKSVMIGTYLNKPEMKKLLSHMGEIDQPWNCPHGRPTMRHLINLDMLPT
ncbi:mismatch repair endonuclease PMS2-like [Mya arenaria]|uniref:mismatch repair endonuclease PMS2-like n=1 Tax=Mya arenaria TaxID=6604 RepID=UPI0022E2CC8E|nr:mismatch repair endonuclease PMS2-like [Mya arenaria]